MVVDYNILADAVAHYQRLGYKYIDVPYIVQTEACSATIPKDLPLRRYDTFLGELVASGEQSFIQMMMDNKLPVGKYVCVTPCFRDEMVIDDLHRHYFMKVELINTLIYRTEINQIVDSTLFHARSFFAKYIPEKYLDITEQNGVKDIEYKGIELGSYGYRECNGLQWIFGTGVAEPRLSIALKK